MAKEDRKTSYGSVVDPVAVLKSAAESILVTTSDLASPGPLVTYVNPAFERMTGWASDEIVGKSPRVLQGPKTDKSIFEDMEQRLRGGKTWEGQAVNYRKDGSEFVMEWSITPIRKTMGMVENYVAVQRDVTDRVETEKRLAEAKEAAFEADRKKDNLARYFSPRTVDLLANRDRPLGSVRRQNLAVLFADIVSFTSLAESLPPERVMALLRSFFRRMETVIFENGGSVERFAGDALMALFGVPDEGSTDASNALTCGRGMIAELRRWNEKRQASGRDPIEIGLGIHYGEAVLGDIGSRRTMAFTAIGDTINVASRLQGLCRQLGVDLVASHEIVERARLEGGDANPAFDKLVRAGQHSIRGRSRSIRVWTSLKQTRSVD